jgi:hypothetical protein
MIFETVASGGGRSYVIGCEGTCAVDTHTHADHFSGDPAARAPARCAGGHASLGIPGVALDGGMKAWREAG